MPALSIMIKPASGMCNMSCDYCFYCDEMQKREQKYYDFMSENTLKNVIRKTLLQAEYNISYVFQGGEPTLRGIDFFRKALEFQKHYNKNNIRVQNALQTNGYALDEEWCKFFYENKFLIGLSVDGTETTHNAMRHSRFGDGTFANVEFAAELMDQYKVDYNILTVVTPPVAENIGDIYTYYKRKNWKYQQYIACLEPLGEEHGTSPYSLKNEIYGQFLIDLFQLW